MTTSSAFRQWIPPAALVLLLATPALALRAATPGMPRYNPATEQTISGTITEVQAHQGRMNRTGVHLLVQTDSGPTDVHLAPTNWLTAQQYAFATGESITVVGSLVTIDGKPALLAREVTRGATVMTFRNKAGIPKWARGGKGRG